MAWLGSGVIITEYTLGVVLPLLLGWITLRPGFAGPAASGWQLILGLWLIGIGMNYIPLLIYAVLIARSGTVKTEG